MPPDNDSPAGHSAPSRRRLPLVAQLLRRSAGMPWEPGALPGFDGSAREFGWLLAGGLGPLLRHAAQASGAAIPAAWQAELRGADLTARVRHASLIETACDVIDAGAASGTPVTLLKGISVSEQLYPAEHLRPMGDIDVLVPRAGYARIEAELLAGDYQRLDYPYLAGRHHGAPLRHRSRGTLVELHVELFPDHSPLRQPGGVLGAAEVMANGRVTSHYHGRPVWRLAPEVQLLYIAASWFNDLTQRPPHPTFLPSLVDAVYLVTRFGGLLEAARSAAEVDNPLARGSLLALLTYLPRFGLRAQAPQQIRSLRAGLPLAGPLELRLIHAMLDRYQIGGRPWNLPLPPPVPGRYSVRHQFNKKLLLRGPP